MGAKRERRRWWIAVADGIGPWVYVTKSLAKTRTEFFGRSRVEIVEVVEVKRKAKRKATTRGKSKGGKA